MQRTYQAPPQSSEQYQQRQAPYQNASGQRQSPAPFGGFKLAGAAPPGQQQQQQPKRGGPRRWTVEQLRASDAIIPLQSGTNQFASQRGMTGFGTPRNTTTSVVGALQQTNENEPMISLQYGTNQFASQRGMTGFGQPRDVAGKHLHHLYEGETPPMDQAGGYEHDGYQQGGYQ